MAWIESHTDLKEHPKFLDLINYAEMDEDTVLGKLHRFWHWTMKYAEDGDLRKFNDGQLCRAVGFNDIKLGKTFIESMVKACWLDREPYFRVHDWWDYAGKYLQGKYKRSPEKWQRIKNLCKGLPENNNGTTTEQQPLTYLTKPNQPNQPKYFSLVQRLKNGILANNPKAKITDSQAKDWADDVRLMLDRDERTEQEIREVIDFSQNDSFWKMNILSMSKLRKQFDQLWLKKENHGKGKRGNTKGVRESEIRADASNQVNWKKPS